MPANIDAASAGGTNQLLVRGEAICVCSGADILEHYWALYPHRRKQPEPLTQEQKAQRLNATKPTPRKTAPVPAPAPAPEPAAEPENAIRTVSLREHASEFTDDEQAILHALEDGAMVTNLLVARTEIPARRVSATLTVLTIRGMVRQLSGGRFEATVKLI